MSKFVFSSDQLPQDIGDKPRFDMWRDIHNATIASIDYTVPDEVAFRARIEGAVIDQVVVGEISGTISGAARGTRNIAEDPGSGNFNLIINNGSTDMWGTQSGREFLLAPGDGALIMGFEPTTMAGRSENSWTSIVLPDALLVERYANVEDRAAISIGAASQALQLLNRYAYMAANELVPESAELRAHMSGVILDLATLSLKPEPTGGDPAASHGQRAARLACIIEFINTNYRYPGISANAVARKFGLSPRYVHDLLQESGQSFSARVLELRLQLSRKLLGSRVGENSSISEIAFDCGFNDISYFNRTFKRRFGCSPRQAR